MEKAITKLTRNATSTVRAANSAMACNVACARQIQRPPPHGAFELEAVVTCARASSFVAACNGGLCGYFHLGRLAGNMEDGTQLPACLALWF